MNHDDWLKSLPGAPSITAAARASGIQKTTLMRQLDRGTIPAENVIAIARAHKVNVIDSLIQTGYVREDEVTIIGVAQALGLATNAEILSEMELRVDPTSSRLFHGEPDDVTPHFDDLEVRRRSNSGGRAYDHDDTVLPYVADSSPDEPEMGDDDYHDGP